VILGGGIVGSNAARMAAGLGAKVVILDVSLNRLRYLADVMPANVTTLYSNRYNILEQIREADIVVGAVLLPGAKAPNLVRREDLKTMMPGLGHRRRGGRPGWLRRDDPADDARGPDLRRRRRRSTTVLPTCRAPCRARRRWR
jgi:threonine dehydrogenase-like Zn-dependent dehydrogenase